MKRWMPLAAEEDIKPHGVRERGRAIISFRISNAMGKGATDDLHFAEPDMGGSEG